MATKLCCIAEEDSGSESPGLPNARVNEVTPAKAPLLPKTPGSPTSQFTSTRTDELHELRQIFNNASDNDTNQPSPPKAGRARLNRPSVYSLHSLHKMKSMHSIIRRKFSRDVLKKPSYNSTKPGGAQKIAAAAALDTVLKQPGNGINLQLKITKDDLKRDLLSDKRPNEGGYDDDAEVLDDIAKNIGKKTSQRPSLHSIEWTPSTGSKPAPRSSSRSRHDFRLPHDIEPYQIRQPQSVSLSSRFGQVFSSPNLKTDTMILHERKLRRSHSATLTGLPTTSPLSPLRLPSLERNDSEGVPWSVALNESLRLRQFLVPPQDSEASRNSSRGPVGDKTSPRQTVAGKTVQSSRDRGDETVLPATIVELRVQEPTVTATPRPSGTFREDSLPTSYEPSQEGKDGEEEGESHTRRSVHLYSMRISHHLRSGSLLSWDQLADAPELPTPHRALRDRSVSDLSRLSHFQKQLARHERQTSSSGFASAKVPSRWGCVVAHDVREDKSSIYSSRPQSPPESLGGSRINLSQYVSKQVVSDQSAFDPTKPALRRSSSYPTGNEEYPRPALKHGHTNIRDATSCSSLGRPVVAVTLLARNNSVESTKLSKFREEFSPSPPKKRLPASVSIMRFLNSKRSSIRSQSEVMLNRSSQSGVDGSLEVPQAAHHERRLSRSMISLETEQKALGNDKKASPMWERALKNHQDERAALFLPKNKALALHSSPIRERSGSVARSRSSADEGGSPRKPSSAKRYSAPLLEQSNTAKVESPEAQPLSPRRTALFAHIAGDPDSSHEVQMRFKHQTDTAETVGAWGRYPSHTRDDRTFSAGYVDSVETRDFALEAAVKFATGTTTGIDDDDIDPATRPVTPPLLPGQKKQKRRVGHARMAKSNSMTFGKAFLKNYTKIFRSQSIEFSKHGHGHRSSITSGGTLEYPELEVLPDVWRRDVIKERSGEHSNSSNERPVGQGEYGPGDLKGKGELKERDLATTLNSLDVSEPCRGSVMPTLDGNAEQPRDTARIWSAYYEDCLPSYPRASAEMDFGLGGFGAPARRSLESRRASMHSRTLPGRFTKHARNASRKSHISVASNGSARVSFRSMAEDGGGVDGRSTFSVRKSTMDLVTLYKEQENTERERVLSLVQMEGKKETGRLAGL